MLHASTAAASSPAAPSASVRQTAGRAYHLEQARQALLGAYHWHRHFTGAETDGTVRNLATAAGEHTFLAGETPAYWDATHGEAAGIPSVREAMTAGWQYTAELLAGEPEYGEVLS